MNMTDYQRAVRDMGVALLPTRNRAERRRQRAMEKRVTTYARQVYRKRAVPVEDTLNRIGGEITGK